MKKTLLSLFAAFAMAATASAQVTYTCTAGKNFGQNEGIDKMFDDNLNTKYCQNAGNDCYALVTASEPVFVWGYDMSTANDNKDYGRCVTRWTLCGTNDENVAKDPNATGWVTLSGFGANGFVQQQNFYTQRFFCDKNTVNTAYKYFKVVLNEGGFIQVSEFKLLGETRPVVTYDWKEGSNNDTKKAVDWLLGQKWEGSGGNSIVGKYLIIETSDGKPHPVESYSMSTHDDGSWNNRAPKSWKLEGSNDMTEWITIDERIDDETIQNENYKTFEFTPSNTSDAVRYLKLTINANKGAGYTQLGEFHVKGGYQYTPATCPEHDIVGSSKQPTCVEAGYVNGTCWKCGYSQNSTNPATGVHIYENDFCTMCQRPDATAMSTVDGFYQPTTAAQFTWLAAMIQYNEDVNIKLTQDVNLSGFAGFGNGTDVVPFKGEFDGQGHWLKNVRIETSEKNTGLFGKVEGANIHDLGLDNCYVKTNQPNGGVLAGNAKNSTINRVAVVKGSYAESWDHTGAIVGNTEGNTVITNCLADITVLSGGYQAGGLVGTSNGLTLENCLFTGEVRNNNYNASGLVSLIDSENAPTTLRNNISAASKIWVGKDEGLYSLINTGGRSATYKNNQVASEIVYAKGNPEVTVNKTLTNPDDQNGKQTATRDMQCKSFLAETMGWDMTNDWKMVAAGQWPVLAWMEAETAQTVTIGAAGYATLVAQYDLNFEGSDVVANAAQVNKNEEGSVYLDPVKAVPAGNAVVLAAQPGEYHIPYAVDYAAPIVDNDLYAATDQVAADGTQYVLAQPEGEKVGFYQVNEGTTIAAGKGYLVMAAGVKAYLFEEETATGICNAIVNENGNTEIYNLAGQKMTKMQKGINIVNGVKVLK